MNNTQNTKAKNKKALKLVKRPSAFWYGLERTLEVFLLPHVQIKRINCDGLKPPYIVIASHSSFTDFPTVNRAIRCRSTWVVSVEEFAGRDWLMRQIGCIYKRKFTNEIAPVKNIIHSVKKLKTTCTFFPEARFSLIGKNEPIDGAIGKLVKTCNCPLVFIRMNGNYLRSPQWNKHPYSKVPLQTEMIQLVTAEEVTTMTADEIQKRVEDNFVYNDYAWQRANNIHINMPTRAENMHRVLYQCPACGTEFETVGKGAKVTCNHCGKSWTLDTLGNLVADDGKDIFTDPCEWYDWQNANVTKQVQDGTYRFVDKVRVERLVDTKTGFVAMEGTAQMIQDECGITVDGTLDGKPFHLHRDAATMSSLHIEYDFKGRGDALDLYDGEYTYWVYPLTAKNVLTKLHFAQIALHKKALGQSK